MPHVVSFCSRSFFVGDANCFHTPPDEVMASPRMYGRLAVRQFIRVSFPEQI